MFLYEKTHRYLKNDYQFFDTSKAKGRKTRGNCNSLVIVKFHELEWNSPLSSWHEKVGKVLPRKIDSKASKCFVRYQ